MADNEPQPALDYEGAGPALEFALWSLGDQIQTIERTDGKSERAITLGITIVALFSGALTFQLDGSGRAGAIVALSASIVVAGCFIAAVWLFFRSYAVVDSYLGPDGRRLLGVSREHEDRRTRQWLAEQIFAAVDSNASGLQAKTNWSTWLFRAVLLEAVAAGGGVIAIAIAAAAA